MGQWKKDFMEVDVNTLEVKELYQMAIKTTEKNDTDAGPINALLPGVHGKGLYSDRVVCILPTMEKGHKKH